ncbi:two-component system response regulator BtsR [Shewanella sp. WXL01]|uniref:two-component system response regulator BtsR n=1 Tax=Shewanella sp. WXL01 TaxID=2709721 RepID=UPI0014384366|nr:two-component system response regulator BtsR [Shewanella sp. WXL01]NKF52424.1 two-component system response regulator BtsR [Shewanella sp. WXL01]
MIRCIIIDDEPFARQEIIDLLDEHDDFEVIAQCGNAIDALAQINQHKPELIFVDIQMPRINGMELIAMLNPDFLPRVVFITAYDEYAVKAFENNAFDYLLKPIDDTRFRKTLEKLRTELTPQDLSTISPTELEQLPCFCGNRLIVTQTQDVEYVMSYVGGIKVFTPFMPCHTQLTLKVLEEKTPLIRCHKQYLVAPSAITEIELLDTGAEITTKSGAKVPVSRRYLKALKQTLGFQ